ncbi:MAG TPA: GTP 3',8-cyclase MoaA [Polyangiales bacterium]|nr:GTP 3',8-cyclase MoaA [Polyangiales bacterium]
MQQPLSRPAPIDAARERRDALGRPLRELRLSVTDRCNFRCGYCMPSDSFREDAHFLPRPEILSYEELARLARLFVSELGVRKLRVTGGEPLLRRDLPRLIDWLAKIPGATDLALTTNGFLLEHLARPLRAAGLARVTVSVDSLDPSQFAAMSGASGPAALERLPRVLAGIDAALAAGFEQLKINCVVIAGQNDSAILPLAERFRGTNHIVRFIEYMDVGTQNAWRANDVVPAAEIVRRISAVWPLEAAPPNHRGEVAQRFRYRDGGGEIGVIASVSQPFCGECQRARLSADGKLLTCLFAQSGFDLKAPLRSGATDTELGELVRNVWAVRRDRYSEQRAELETRAHSTPIRSNGERTHDRRRLEMYQVGG